MAITTVELELVKDIDDLAKVKASLKELKAKEEKLVASVKGYMKKLKIDTYSTATNTADFKSGSARVVNVAAFKELVTEKEFLATVKVTLGDLDKVLSGNMQEKCVSTVPGAATLNIKAKK